MFAQQILQTIIDILFVDYVREFGKGNYNNQVALMQNQGKVYKNSIAVTLPYGNVQRLNMVPYVTPHYHRIISSHKSINARTRNSHLRK